MKIEDYIIEEYVAGWVVKTPRMGKDENDKPKLHYKESFYSNLQQCLGKVRDSMAKDCETVEELIFLLSSAEAMDNSVLRSNGLLRAPSVVDDC